jgi:hypothetical protein
VRRARTDARGRFTLRDVGPGEGYLWAPAPGVAADQHGVVLSDQPGAVWLPLWPSAGRAHAGRVVDGNGKPLPDVIVYSDQFPRGPATRTDERGRFRLVGVAEDAELAAARGRVIANPEHNRLAESGELTEQSEVRLRPPGKLDDYSLVGDAEVEDGWIVTSVTAGGLRVVRFAHAEYGDGEIVVDADQEMVEVGPDAFPVPGRLIAPPHARTYVYEANGWEEVGPSAYRLRAGAWIRLVGDPGWKTVVRQLEGASPWRVDWGNAALRFDVQPREWSALVDGEWLADAPRLLRGLDPGAHTILLSAKGHRSKAVRVVLREGETRTLQVTLDSDAGRAPRSTGGDGR